MNSGGEGEGGGVRFGGKEGSATGKKLDRVSRGHRLPYDECTMTDTCCTTCRDMLGIVREHGIAVCPTRQSLWCSQCSCYGHLADTCDVARHVWRPATLEELIPADVRERWGIRTRTPIIYERTLSLEDAEREIAESNTLEIRYREGKQDNRIREVMRGLKIPTVHKMDGNILKLRTWAISQGKKVRLVQE
jgi:hypothetical protein